LSFFDTYQEIGGNFVKADEKAVMMSEGIPFTVTGIVEDPANKYGPRYVVAILLPNAETGEEEERAIGFPQGTVESRDRMLFEMKAYLEGEGDKEPVVCKLEQIGRSIIIRQA
jgi:hypothetical protein